MPECFQETPDGLVLVANGHDPVLRWDGLLPYMEEAGLSPPLSALTLSSSGNGSIVGTYYAYLRFVDRLGNYSNLSPISNEHSPSGSTGTVTDATNTTPIVITSAGHGLSTGATVKIEGVGGNTSANNTWTITVYDANSFALDDSSGTATYTGGGTWTSGVDTIAYSSVPTTDDPKVVRRQILRNTDGQATTFYVDVDTEDLSATTFSSTKNDTALATGTAVPLLNEDGSPLANRYGIPPNNKAVLAHHRDRMFAAVDREYSGGNVQVEFGSSLVTGIGTQFTSSMAGRVLYVDGAEQYYEIDSVDTVNQTLTLIENYLGTTDKFALYAIRSVPAEKRLVYFSESGLPEAWPAVNAVELQEDGDYITGMMSNDSFLYILENAHIYRSTFLENPTTDGAIFLSANRGCVNNRCWLSVDGFTYLLDEEGIYSFSANEDVEPISEPIADMFSTTDANERFRINWQSKELFHAVHFRPDATMRWFVALSGEWLPRHAICYNYRDSRWWVEEYAVPIGASVHGYMRRVPTLFYGTHARTVLAYGTNTLDGPNGNAGTVRGTVTSSTLTSFSDSGARFASDLVGHPVSIVSGRGKEQTRVVTKVVDNEVFVDFPWVELPDTTSKYQLGGIKWNWKSGWFRFVPEETQNVRRAEIVFEPLVKENTFDMKFYFDFSENGYEWETTTNNDERNGADKTKGSADVVCDLMKPTGVVQAHLPGHKTLYADGRRYTQLELKGFTGKEIIRIYQVSYDGVIG